MPIALAIGLLAVSAPVPAPATNASTLDEFFLQTLADAISAEGLDPNLFFDAPVDVTLIHHDGSVETLNMPFRDALSTLVGD